MDYRVLDYLHHPVLVLEPAGKLLYINKEALRVTGLDRERLLGRPFFHDAALPEEARGDSAGTSSQGRTLNAIRLTFHNPPDGASVLFIEWVLEDVPSADGKAALVVASGQNITRIRKIRGEALQFHAALEAIREAVMITDPEGIIHYVNPAFEKTTGYHKDEVLGKGTSILKSDRQSEEEYSEMLKSLEKEGRWSGSLLSRRANGSTFDCEESITTIELPGEKKRHISVLRDVTERNSYENQLKDSLQYAQKLIDHAPVGVWIANLYPYYENDPSPPFAKEYHRSSGVIIDTDRVNQRLCAMLGVEPDRILGRSLFDAAIIDDTEAFNALKEVRELRAGNAVSFETRLLKYNGKPVPVLIEAIPILMDDDGTALQVMAMVLDMTERKWVENQLQQSENELKWTLKKLFQANQSLEDNFKRLEDLSTTDELTGVPNRRRFQEFLGHEWRRSVRNRTRISIILFDIDYFKYFNDTYGHQAGDECLKSVAMLLNEEMKRSTDLFARYGGEEFVAILAETDLEGAKVVAEKMRKAVEDAALENSRSELNGIVTLSIGVSSVMPTDDVPMRELVELADIALYRAKEAGRNRVFAAEYGVDMIEDLEARRNAGSMDNRELDETQKRNGIREDESDEFSLEKIENDHG